MRKFRLIVDPIENHYACGIVQGSVYLGESLIESNDNRPAFKIQDLAEKYPKEWDEVFDWISVNDRLPEVEGTVLGCTHYGKIVIAYFMSISNEWEITGFDEVKKLKFITHWMPLPPPLTQ